MIESVDARLLSRKPARGESPRIPSLSFEEGIVRSVREYLAYMRQVGAELPIAIMVSLLGVRGYQMAAGQQFFQYEETSIDRDVIPVPEVIVDDFECDVLDVLRPVFDTAWQAAGFSRSLNFDAAGQWRGRK
jgi:hypothetical protein